MALASCQCSPRTLGSPGTLAEIAECHPQRRVDLVVTARAAGGTGILPVLSANAGLSGNTGKRQCHPTPRRSCCELPGRRVALTSCRPCSPRTLGSPGTLAKRQCHPTPRRSCCEPRGRRAASNNAASAADQATLASKTQHQVGFRDPLGAKAIPAALNGVQPLVQPRRVAERRRPAVRSPWRRRPASPVGPGRRMHYRTGRSPPGR